jgi:hypothetical protein
MRLVLATLLAIGLHAAAHGQSEAGREAPPTPNRASVPPSALDHTGHGLAADAKLYEESHSPGFKSNTNLKFVEDTLHGSIRFMCYVDGVKHGYLHAQDLFTSGHPDFKFPQLNFPAGVTNGQQQAVVAKYLREHPETLHLPAFTLVIEALAEAFPPKTK